MDYNVLSVFLWLRVLKRKFEHKDWLEFDPGNASVVGGRNADIFTVGWCRCFWKGSAIETTRFPTMME